MPEVVEGGAVRRVQLVELLPARDVEDVHRAGLVAECILEVRSDHGEGIAEGNCIAELVLLEAIEGLQLHELLPRLDLEHVGRPGAITEVIVPEGAEEGAVAMHGDGEPEIVTGLSVQRAQRAELRAVAYVVDVGGARGYRTERTHHDAGPLGRQGSPVGVPDEAVTRAEGIGLRHLRACTQLGSQ